MLEDVARRFAFNITTALHFLHSRRILHGNVCTENIILSDSDLDKAKAYLAGFKLAIKLDSKTHQVVDPKGCPEHPAPEICRGKPYGFAADIWSLGCTIQKALTSRLPELNKNGSIQKSPAAAVIYLSTVSEDCQNFIQSLLAVDPNQRPTAQQALFHTWFRALS